MAYEGARSVTGPFLGTLGANGFIVGTVAGLGELLGYVLRFASGRYADRSRLYWPMTIAGYIVQMLAVPALALAGNWPVAAGLIVLERIGKATRNPPRDVMLSHAGEKLGQGWAFGLNEALDQLGALIGPLAIAAAVARTGNYRLALALLAVPAAITLITVFSTRLRFPHAGRVSPKAEPRHDEGGFTAQFWWYTTGSCMLAFGFADYSLVAYHFTTARSVSPAATAVYYAVAMGAGGVASLAVGKAFDKLGLVILLPVTVITAFYAPLVFLGSGGIALAGTILWGIGLGAHESVMQAAVASMVSHQRRGSA
jgi:predicted MFS family arabinose efflux permease